MRWSLPLVVLLVTACTPAQAAGWLPRLVVRGGAAHRGGRSTGGVAERWDWRVEGGLAWRLDRAPALVPPATPKVTAGGVPPAELACIEPVICAWERRARARALAAEAPEGGEP